METIKRFFRDEEGVTAIEYGLIAALIAVAIIVATQTLGGKISSTFNTVSGNTGVKTESLFAIVGKHTSC